jgi:hypothetical protein
LTVGLVVTHSSTARRDFQADPTGRHGMLAYFPGVALRFTPGYSPAIPTGGFLTEAPDKIFQTEDSKRRLQAGVSFGDSRQRVQCRRVNAGGSMQAVQCRGSLCSASLDGMLPMWQPSRRDSRRLAPGGAQRNPGERCLTHTPSCRDGMKISPRCSEDRRRWNASPG